MTCLIDITTGQLHNGYLFAGGKGALAPLSYHYHAANADCLVDSLVLEGVCD